MVFLSDAVGRVLAEEAIARRTQPPADLSAMDGYAVRAEDVSSVPARLTVVGEAPAGGSYTEEVKSGQAVRIFTGAPLPRGADTIVIQEDTTRDGDIVTVNEAGKKGTHVRPCGLDFRTGDAGMPAGRKLSPADIAFAAAMNLATLEVHKRPIIAFFSTGDELVPPAPSPARTRSSQPTMTASPRSFLKQVASRSISASCLTISMPSGKPQRALAKRTC